MTLVRKSSCRFFRVRISVLSVFFAVRVAFVVNLVVGHVYSTFALAWSCVRLLVRLMLCAYTTVFVWLVVPVPVSLEIYLQVSVLYSATYTLRDCVII